VQYKIGDIEVKLSPTIVRDYLTGGMPVSDSEYKLFVDLCRARKLNPFLKEVYIIKYSQNSPATIVVGQDAIVKRATTHPQFDGYEEGLYVQTEKGDIEERKGAFYLPTEKIVGAWAKVYRKDWSHPITKSVAFGEVAQRKKDGSLNSMWATQPATMALKVAKVRAMREAFVEDLSGLYTEEEQQNIEAIDTDIVEPTEAEAGQPDPLADIEPIGFEQQAQQEVTVEESGVVKL